MSGRLSAFAQGALRCQPDQRLVALAREGHERALEEIVRRYRSPLVAFAGAIVGPSAAEDVVQEAFARGHVAIGRADHDLEIRPWLYTVVRNRALTVLRDERPHEQLDPNYDGVPQPPQIAERRQELAALVASVKDLPEGQRQALVARELEGRSHEEIASRLGVSPAAARGLIFRARMALRDAAGLLVPFPLLQALASDRWVGAAKAGTVGGSAVGAAGGGGALAIKAGLVVALSAVAVGSGVVLRSHGGGTAASGPSAAQASALKAHRSRASSAGASAGASVAAGDPAERNGSSAPRATGNSNGSTRQLAGSSGSNTVTSGSSTDSTQTTSSGDSSQTSLASADTSGDGGSTSSGDSGSGDSSTSSDTSGTSGDSSGTSGDTSGTSGDTSSTSGDSSGTSSDTSGTSSDTSSTSSDTSSTSSDTSSTSGDSGSGIVGSD